MVVVTGANGFIGSVIVSELNRCQIPVVASVDTIGLSTRNLLVGKKSGQFLLKDELWDFLNHPESASKVKWIIHMGANSSTTETDWNHLYENNFFYTQRIFEWCARHQKGLIYASSAATYGNGDQGYNDETDHEQLMALNLYGKSKLIFDQWAQRQQNFPQHYYGLKFFNVYGPNEYHKGSMLSVPYRAVHQIRETGQLKLFKSYRPDYQHGEQKRDFIYVKDIAQWCVELMQKKPKSGIYNQGSGQARTWKDLGLAVFSAMNVAPKFDFIDMPDNLRNQYQYFTEASMTKWQNQGMSPAKYSLESGVADYVQNYLNQTGKSDILV